MPVIPDYIDRQTLLRALNDLGIEVSNLRGISTDAYRVTLHYFATNESGKRFLIDGAPAELSYEVGIETRPDDTRSPSSAEYQQVASTSGGNR